MKKHRLVSIAAFLMVLVLALSMVACAEEPSATSTDSQSSESPAISSVNNTSVSQSDGKASGIISIADNTSSNASASASASDDNQQSASGEPTPTAGKLIKEYLSAVVETTNQSPYSYIPAAMQPGCSANLVTEAHVTYNFANFTSVSSVKYGGFGEQWNMVVDNIAQSQLFYNYLTVGESVLTASVALMNEYLDNLTTQTADHVEDAEKFKATLKYSGGVLDYTVEYKTQTEIPFFGKVIPKITMTYDVNNKTKSVLVTLTETNAMRYTVTDNKYEFGIEYGVNAANRSAYCQLIRNDYNSIEGHIYEYITVKDKDAVKSCADFYINNEYVSVVGNKASGMPGFTGYINELYKTSSGKLLGYEVQETLSVAGISGTYNTLWFNLSDISGITSVKLTEKTDDNNSSLSTLNVYLNGNDTLLSPTYNTKVFVKTSRKYDVELRTQYFYGKNADGDIVEYKTNVPMMFIQQDNDKDTNFSDFPSDMKKDNGLTVSVSLSTTYLNKIIQDHASLTEVFKSNKELVDSQKIKSYIGY